MYVHPRYSDHNITRGTRFVLYTVCTVHMLYLPFPKTLLPPSSHHHHIHGAFRRDRIEWSSAGALTLERDYNGAPCSRNHSYFSFQLLLNAKATPPTSYIYYCYYDSRPDRTRDSTGGF
jgi:hypothetical protein